MKRAHVKRHFLWLDIAVAFMTIILVGTGIWFGTIKKDTNDLTCKAVGAEHQLTIKSDAFSTSQLTLKRCDTIKIVNTGTENYELTFGTHDNLINYPGFTRQPLRPNEFFVVDAVQAGTYTMHDHIRAKAHIELDIKAE